MMQQTEEPWVPAGLKEKLVVGARVRFRMSLECQIAPHPTSAAYRDNPQHRGLYEEEDGRTGTIAATDRTYLADHPFLIKTDDWYPIAGLPGQFNGIDAAAIELIPLAEGGEA